ncbi:uncharacterized protein V1518DRAFT_412089 [Limtongia smithiae]|uniref:uncharacterized protein n=1 Tax=Limtongia smithiae TaxID=1125753 RepID=UPI0034CE8439
MRAYLRRFDLHARGLAQACVVCFIQHHIVAMSSPKPGNNIENNGVDAEIEGLVLTASKAYGLKKYEDATEGFARACEIYVENNGKDDPNLLFLYGRALFQVAVSSSDVLGGSGVTEPQKELISAKAVEMTARRPEINDGGAGSNPGTRLFQFTGDGPESDDQEEDDDDDDDDDYNDGGDKQEDRKEDESDFETAWDVLDLARTLFERQVKELSEDDDAAKLIEIKTKTADIYDILGEISLESENFQQASTDLLAAVELKQELYPIHSTLVSEACFKLSLALEFVPDSKNARQQAAVYVRKAIDSVEQRTKVTGEEDADLLNDLNTRLRELEAPKSDSLGAGPLSDALGESESDIKNRLVDAITQAQDISGLVKRKRPTESEAAAASSSSSVSGMSSGTIKNSAPQGSTAATTAKDEDSVRKKQKT